MDLKDKYALTVPEAARYFGIGKARDGFVLSTRIGYKQLGGRNLAHFF